MSDHLVTSWPVLTSYDSDHLRRIALPLGGIGTGTVSLGGRGDLRDWEIMNQPAKGVTPANAFFTLHTCTASGVAGTRVLEGPIDVADYEGAFGCTVPNHGLPRFSSCSFHAAYPFGQVRLEDNTVPVEVCLQAFNPLIPGDADASGIPVAVLRYVLKNNTAETVTASICGSVPNLVDAGGTQINVPRMEGDGSAPHGVLLRVEDGDEGAEKYGTMALAALTDAVTHRCAWANRPLWGGALLDFWDDFTDDGKLVDRELDGQKNPIASVAATVEIPAQEERAITFLLSWHFPNRMTWTPTETVAKADGCDSACDCHKKPTVNPDRIGNYYTTRDADAWAVIERVAVELPALEAQTLMFVQSFCDSDLPAVVKEAALYNISTLRTQTCFRTEDGFFYAWEGCSNTSGCCQGSCTHVWNYEQATAFLFGDISRKMREIEFLHATREDGLMCFRVNLPLSRAVDWGYAAADGQMGCLMKLYRDWQLSGDDDMLRRLWPHARKSLEFCWIPNGWDGDQDGVMEGCQHNTMDVEYFGPNGQMSGWYLGALRASEEMARYLGEIEFAGQCRTLFEQGRQWVDTHLFNGEYYEQEVRPPMRKENIAPSLQVGMGTGNMEDPEFQLGTACLVDQLIGQLMADVCNLGKLLDAGHVRTTLQSIMRHNFRSLHDQFNYMRTFALQDESALLMSTYPRGNRPTSPFPYSTEVMTGFEYTAAIHMLYEGMLDDGLTAITAIRQRYDGRKRSPFNEAECGHHYGRAMISWAAVLALTGFHFSAVDNTIAFAAKEGRCFWSNGNAWGNSTQRNDADGITLSIQVLYGTLTLQHIKISGYGSHAIASQQTIVAGEIFNCLIKPEQVMEGDNS